LRFAEASDQADRLAADERTELWESRREAEARRSELSRPLSQQQSGIVGKTCRRSREPKLASLQREFSAWENGYEQFRGSTQKSEFGETKLRRLAKKCCPSEISRANYQYWLSDFEKTI
jgi:hypothetical protein